MKRRKKTKPCEFCYDKGYTTSAGMFKLRYATLPRFIVYICTCPRGMQIRKYFSLKKQFKP